MADIFLHLGLVALISIWAYEALRAIKVRWERNHPSNDQRKNMHDFLNFAVLFGSVLITSMCDGFFEQMFGVVTSIEILCITPVIGLCVYILVMAKRERRRMRAKLANEQHWERERERREKAAAERREAQKNEPTPWSDESPFHEERSRGFSEACDQKFWRR